MSTGPVFYYKSSLCNPESMLRKARDRKFVCLRKPQPAPDFRGPAAPIPPLCFRALFLLTRKMRWLSLTQNIGLRFP